MAQGRHVATPYEVVFTVVALRQIEAIDEWWRAHRVDASVGVRDEIARARLLLSAHPQLGPVLRGTRDVRRLLLRATSYWLYYRLVRRTVRVLRVWHTSRASPTRR